MKMFKKIISKNKSLINYYREKKQAPLVCYNSDLYIVEFPKSGITWFSTIIASFYWIKDQRSKFPTHFSLEQVIADVHKTKNIVVPEVYPYHRTIKSHANYNSNYRNVVYLIRNPFSVMQSYYFFATSRKEYSGSFESFVADPRFGISAWNEHVESWLNPPKEPNLQLIRYEDILEKPKETLSKLFLSIGFKFTESELERAIELADFNEMKVDNNRYKDLCPFRDYDFVREGKSKYEISDEAYNFIKSKSKSVIDRLYPEYI